MLEPYPRVRAYLDLAFYEQCAAFYKKSKTWTWSQAPVVETNLYRVHTQGAVAGPESVKGRETK